MTTFIGFNTQNSGVVRPSQITTGTDAGSGSFVKPQYFGKKFTGYDEQIVIQDLINALNIQQGSKPGNPKYGTTIWNFIFEPNDIETQSSIDSEIRRVAAQDPRIVLNDILTYPADNGILVEVEFAITPFNNVRTLQILFDSATNSASTQ
jgi:phage baseplate assembly protein W